MKVSDKITAYESVRPRLNEFQEQEAFVAVALDSQLETVGEPWVAGVGSVASVDVHPRDIFREAIKRNAHSLLVAHNHPSGRSEPSSEDDAITKTIQSAGKLLGVPLVDHIICGKSVYSYNETGRL